MHIFTQTHKRIIYNVALVKVKIYMQPPPSHKAHEALENFKEFVSSQKTIKINPLLFYFKPYFCKGTCTDVYRRRYNVVEAFGLDHRTHSIKHVGHYNKSEVATMAEAQCYY